MNSVRKSYFSGSWYPGTAKDIHRQLNKWDEELGDFKKNIVSGVVPHAGWFFSGMLAYDVIRRIEQDTELVIVLGGHLPESSPILYCNEKSFQTPCGNLVIDGELVNLIESALPSEYDSRTDNTVEVQLPIIKSLLDEVRIVPLRVPAGESALNLIDVIRNYSDKKNLKIRVIGSTDLTHYGSNYDFEPTESLADPIKWVEIQDRKIIESMIEMKPEDILKEARSKQSACSAGAAACAASYASKSGIKKGKLLSYDTSYSKHQSDSFVGYGAVVYEL